MERKQEGGIASMAWYFHPSRVANLFFIFQTTLQWFGERAGQFHDDVIWRKEPITAAGENNIAMSFGETKFAAGSFSDT